MMICTTSGRRRRLGMGHQQARKLTMKFTKIRNSKSAKGTTDIKQAQGRAIWKRVLAENLAELDAVEQARGSKIIADNWIDGNLAEADALCRPLANERYRAMSTLRATQVFSQHLCEHLVSLLNIPLSDMGLDGGFENADLSVFEAIWRARQTADMLGMRYESYIDSIICAYFEADAEQIGYDSFSGTQAAAIARYKLTGPTEGMPLPEGVLRLSKAA
jgi:hypothetical protein